MRWRLVLEYDGRDFIGWGLQPKGRSIQGVVEQALESLLGHPTRVRASGRTDTGVHALGQVITLDTGVSRSPKAMVSGMNHHLPLDVACVAADVVPDDWDPRWQSREKHYRYVWLRRLARSPLRQDRVYHVTCALDVDRMNRAVQALAGTHDFTTFRASGCGAKSTVRTIPFWAVTDHGDEVHLDVRGNGFLRHMIRIVAGTLTDIGRGAEPEDLLETALLARDRDVAGPTAPACGLTLMSVLYDGD